jgi:hypothetical protein
VVEWWNDGFPILHHSITPFSQEVKYMLTASNKTTKQAQEVLTSGPGGLLVSQEECRSYHVTESQTLSTGPCRLIGIVLVSAMEASTILLESDTNMLLKLRSAAGWSQSAFLTFPLACPADLAVTLTGTAAEAYVFVADPS